MSDICIFICGSLVGILLGITLGIIISCCCIKIMVDSYEKNKKDIKDTLYTHN